MHTVTATAVVLAVGIIADSVIAVTSSVASIGGPQYLSDGEGDQVLSHKRIDFDAHIKRFTGRKFCHLYRLPKANFLPLVNKLPPS
jgi:hypothetical protein